MTGDEIAVHGFKQEDVSALGLAHQLDLGWVAHLDPVETGFLEIAVGPERISIDERDLILPEIGVIAELRQ
jgi:hypothetical protein